MFNLFEPTWQELWAGASEEENVGAVYTKPEIVATILDLAGYRPSARRLASERLLEPSCGDGAFIAEVVRRLIASEVRSRGAVEWGCADLTDCIRAIDLNAEAVSRTKRQIAELLEEHGCPSGRARELSDSWVSQGDFLLAHWPDRFNYVVGNPPYVRLEGLPKTVLREYRRRFETLTDRADLYVAFIQRGLELLADDGVLAFICANRFAKNQYGAALRKLVASKYRVRYYVNLEHTQPFVTEVAAYPAIVVLDRQVGKSTRAGTLHDISDGTLAFVRGSATRRTAKQGPLAEFRRWYPNGEPWSSTSKEEVEFLSSLERAFPTLEQSGGNTRVGIGVATGADEVFVLPEWSSVIEATRQIPLLLASDVRAGEEAWSGHFLVNPFDESDDGSLVDLDRYPGLRKHLLAHADALEGRHVAKSRPSRWFRTIDRIWPRLTATPKLVIPDIQQGGVVGFDDGRYYPHHNLYWITSDSWHLPALQALLRSSHILMQVRAHSVQMRGGSVRYQAQTLRRLRLPAWDSLSSAVIDRLVSVATSSSLSDIDAAASEAYGVRLALDVR